MRRSQDDVAQSENLTTCAGCRTVFHMACSRELGLAAPGAVAAGIAFGHNPRPLRVPLRRSEVEALQRRPLLELVFEAATVHRAHHDAAEIQCSTLVSIKTGACPEDCSYCPQSAHYATGPDRERLLDTEAVVAAARDAKASGADRFCMGAAWRDVPHGEPFERVLEMVSQVKALGLETCATLGMCDLEQAEALSQAGLDYYNHNLDTSREFYGEIIRTRTWHLAEMSKGLAASVNDWRRRLEVVLAEEEQRFPEFLDALDCHRPVPIASV